MIHWLRQEDGEGQFHSKFFRNDENEDELIVYANSDSPDFMECAINVWRRLIIFMSL